ncbi:hypothetical protein ACE6H2_015217 [Prunus campanulata]
MTTKSVKNRGCTFRFETLTLDCLILKIRAPFLSNFIWFKSLFNQLQDACKLVDFYGV